MSQSACVSGRDTNHSLDTSKRDTQVDQSLRNKIIEYARNFESLPYKRNGRDERGFDCSGFVRYVLKNFMIEVPPSSQEIAYEGKTIDIESVKKGDLILFGDKKRVNHVGIVTEHKKNKLMVIHSSSSKGVIEEDVLKSDYWLKRIRLLKDVESYKTNKLAFKRR